jgi:hypothetical protein
MSQHFQPAGLAELFPALPALPFYRAVDFAVVFHVGGVESVRAKSPSN